MPNYTVSQLTTVGDCDAVLSIANQEQEDLNWKKLSLERQKEQYSESSAPEGCDFLKYSKKIFTSN